MYLTFKNVIFYKLYIMHTEHVKYNDGVNQNIMNFLNLNDEHTHTNIHAHIHVCTPTQAPSPHTPTHPHAPSAHTQGK